MSLVGPRPPLPVRSGPVQGLAPAASAGSQTWNHRSLAGHRTKPYHLRRNGAAGSSLREELLRVDRREDSAGHATSRPFGQRRALGSADHDQPSSDYLCIAPDVTLGKDVKLAKFINLYGCTSVTRRRSALRRDSEERQRRTAMQDLQSHVHLRGRDDRRQRVHRPRRHVHQRLPIPRATTAAGELQTADDWTGRDQHS